MGMFKDLSTESLEAPVDYLGGNFDPIATGVYEATIKLAFAGQSKSSKAQSVTLHLDLDGKELRETVYVTNRNNENFYVDKTDKTKRHPLPGWTAIDDICLLTTQDGLNEQVDETKTIKLYDPDAKKETNQEVQVFTALIGQKIKVAVLRQIVDKQKKNESSGAYENTGETRTENAIDKAFHAESGRTVAEYRHEIDPGEFMEAWKAKNDGKDRNKSKGGAASGNGSSGSGQPGAPGGKTPAKKLFG